MTPDQLQFALKAMHQESFNWALTQVWNNPSEAQDVLQNAYLKVLEGKAKFNGDSSVKTWFFSVIRHTAIDMQRKRVVRNKHTETLQWEQQNQVTQPSDIEVVTANSSPLNRIIEQLSEKQREVLQLVFYHGNTIEEAATIMEIGVGSARTHYDRGKKKMKALIEEQGKDSFQAKTI